VKEILIATKNSGKVREFNELFKAYGITVTSLVDIQQDVPDIQETGSTFHENAGIKAEQIKKFLNKPVLADDSGLVIDALYGEPGIYSARYAGEPKSDKQNYEKVLDKMQDVHEQHRIAHFICVLALAIPGEDTLFKEGRCSGKIAHRPRGINGFGYDPIFIPDGYSKTMAELTEQEKNKISHRYHAIIQLKKWLDATLNKGE